MAEGISGQEEGMCSLSVCQHLLLVSASEVFGEVKMESRHAVGDELQQSEQQGL